MNREAVGYVAGSLLANLVLAVCFVFVVASLVQERSTNKIQMTVSNIDLLERVGEVQVLCRCVADVKPLGDDKGMPKYWRIVAKY